MKSIGAILQKTYGNETFELLKRFTSRFKAPGESNFWYLLQYRGSEVDDCPCEICGERNLDTGVCWFPGCNINSFEDLAEFPIKIILCGFCYISYNSSVIGRKISIVRANKESLQKEILFKRHVYDFQKCIERTFLYINHKYGFSGYNLPNEIVFKILDHLWCNYIYEKRRDGKKFLLDQKRKVQKKERRATKTVLPKKTIIRL